MKKIYVTPLCKVKELFTADGLLYAASDNSLEEKFNSTVNNEHGDHGDYGRDNKGNNRNPSIWDQGW